MTDAPLIAYNGHRHCDCGLPEPIRYCDSDCTRSFRGPLEEGSCIRCIFWLGHLHGDHRGWYELKESRLGDKTVRP